MPETEQQHDPDAAALHEWKLWKDRIATAQAKERELRSAIVTKHFPDPKEGTNNKVLTTADGRQIKLKLTYAIDRKIDQGVISNLVRAVFDARSKGESHPLFNVNFDTVVRNKPELAVTAYKALTTEEKLAFDACLTIKPGSAQFTFEVVNPEL